MPRSIVVRLFDAMLISVLVAACGGGASSPVITKPVISTAQPLPGTTGAAYRAFAFAVTSGGLAPFTWNETGALPPGLALNSAGVLSGTPTFAGTFPITVTVTDSSSPPMTDSIPISLTITDSAIVVDMTPAPPAGTVTYLYNNGNGFGFTASGGSPASGGAAPYSWTVTAGTLPPGLAINCCGWLLFGTPTSAGTFTFTVTATDSSQPPETGSQSFTVVVNNPPPPVINQTPAPPAGVADEDYPDFNFTAAGGYLPLASWAVTAGALPPGLTLGTGGWLSGIPTQIGSFAFTVTVTDSAPTPAMNSAAFTIAITAPPAPTINNTPPPTGTVGTPYQPFAFAASNGYLPLVWSETGTLPTGLGLSVGGVLAGTPGNAGQFPITLNVTDALSRNAPSAPTTVRVSLARPAAGFTLATGNMTIPRSGHSATLLTSGEVLIAGGPNATAELYDPTSQTFAATGSMTVARSGHTATLLADKALPNYGYVLLAAGGSQTAELYDPTTGTFTATGSMVVAHDEPTATLLPNGQVLIAGGGTASAEVYDPAAGTFTATGNMTVSRTGQTATLLPNGEVLIAGGGTAAAELYDPTNRSFTATGSMSEARTGHTATLLANGPTLTNGSVLIAGPDNTAEIFDPVTGSFSLVGNLLTAVSGSTANLRNDGTIVIAGGYSVVALFRSGFQGSPFCGINGHANVSLSAAELFAPESEGFTATASLNTARYGHAATTLADGTVLVTGGVLGTTKRGDCSYRPVSSTSTVLSTAELFQ